MPENESIKNIKEHESIIHNLACKLSADIADSDWPTVTYDLIMLANVASSASKTVSAVAFNEVGDLVMPEDMESTMQDDLMVTPDGAYI